MLEAYSCLRASLLFQFDFFKNENLSLGFIFLLKKSAYFSSDIPEAEDYLTTLPTQMKIAGP